MNVLISSEVQENRILAKSEPWRYRVADTYLIACSVCDNNFYTFNCVKISREDPRGVIHMMYITLKIERKLST